MESAKWLVGSASLWCHPRSLPVFPAAPHPSVMQPTLIILDGVRSASLWQRLAQLEKLGAHSHAFTFPYGRIMDQESLSWHWAMLPLGKGECRSSKTVPLTIFSVSNLRLFLLQWCARTSPLKSQTSTKALSSIRWLSKLMFFGENGRKFLFCPFD